MITFSHERQDEFASIVCPYENGFFLDVACGNPITGSNTYLFEQIGWSGMCFDLDDVETKYSWSNVRKAKFSKLDATSTFFTDFLIENLEDKIIDYLSLDVDIGGHYEENLSPKVLPRILEAGVTFKCATVEHESFKYGNVGRDFMRNLLLDKGYSMLFEGVKFPNGNEWEDWWINPNLVSKKFCKRYCSVDYNQAIEILSSL